MTVCQVSLGKLKGDRALVAKGKAEVKKSEAEEKTGEAEVIKGEAEVTKGKEEKMDGAVFGPLVYRWCSRCPSLPEALSASHTPSRYAASGSHRAFFRM